MTNKIAIVGGRDFWDYALMKQTVDAIISDNKISNVEIVSGGAKGADSLAERYAIEHNYPITIFYPDWNLYGKSAGPIRNEQIVTHSDIVIAFWDGESKGTMSSIELTEYYGKKLYITNY